MVTHEDIHKFFYSYTNVKGYKQIKGRKSPDTILEKWSCIFPNKPYIFPDVCIKIDYDRSKNHHEDCRCEIYSRIKCNRYKTIAKKTFSQSKDCIDDINKFFNKNIKKFIERTLVSSKKELESHPYMTTENEVIQWCENYLSNN